MDDLSKKVFKDPLYFFAYGFGSGLMPGAPGTAGSIVGLLLWFLLSPLPLLNYLITLLVILVLGVYVADKVSAEMEVNDPSGIVIDEIAGLMIAFLFLPDGWYWIVAGFVLFRFFDILKPWPISWCDRNLKGGMGIMFDDVLAGLFSFLLIQAAFLISSQQALAS